ncbi:MAG: MotA/TolQ/ExbB proton channel family protein [bacterium]|nr:MotA/TolQ/ExbB proton channel family protein [bacterium]
MFEAAYESALKGGPVLVVIILTSVTAFTLIIERWIFLSRQRTRPEFLRKFFDLERKAEYSGASELCAETRGPVARIMQVGITNRQDEKEVVRERIREVILEELPGLERYLSTIAVLGTIMPLLGLLGTVTGMISTFNVLSIAGTTDPNALAAGISEALITTEAGLITAIPTMLFHNFLSNKVDRLQLEMESSTTKFLNLL